MNTEIAAIIAEMEKEEEILLTNTNKEEISEEIEEEIKDDELVESVIEPVITFKVGDKVQLTPNARYASGASIPASLKKNNFYICQVLKDNKYVLSLNKTGKSNGIVFGKDLIAYTDTPKIEKEPLYYCLIMSDSVDVKSRPDKTSKTLKTLHRNGLYTVMEEKNDWCHLKIGGWIPSEAVRKLTV